MAVTLSVIKADIGGFVGHSDSHPDILELARECTDRAKTSGLLIDCYVTKCGDDLQLIMTHQRGASDGEIHKFAWDTFVDCTELATKLKLYGAGQDWLADAFSGNVRGMGPAVAEMEFDERPNEPFLFFAADKTDPGAFNLPLYLAFADPMNTPGLMLAPAMAKGFRFAVMDVNHTQGDRLIELDAPEGLYEIAALLRDTERYVVESIRSRAAGEIAAVASTSRLHNIAGKYTGKDDPVLLVRVQSSFPATGEVLAPYALGAYVAGGMRGSHNMPLMPVAQDSGISYFDGPPVVSCAAFAMHEGRLTEPVDAFAHPFWNRVRDQVAAKAIEMRRQGFFGAAMLPMSELEYTGIMEKLKMLDGRFRVRVEKAGKVAETV